MRGRYSKCCYRCSRKSTDVKNGTFCTVKTFYWIITPYHESLETSPIQNSTDTWVFQKLIGLARDFLQLTSDDFISRPIMSDEAQFHLTGHVSKQNCRYWSDSNPRIVYERPLHPLRITVWCGMTCEIIIGSYFLRMITDELWLLQEILTGDVSRNI